MKKNKICGGKENEKLAINYNFKACTFTSFLLENKYLTQINNRISIELNKLQRKIKK